MKMLNGHIREIFEQIHRANGQICRLSLHLNYSEPVKFTSFVRRLFPLRYRRVASLHM